MGLRACHRTHCSRCLIFVQCYVKLSWQIIENRDMPNHDDWLAQLTRITDGGDGWLEACHRHNLTQNHLEDARRLGWV
jgi:hypothetical protein